MQREIVLDTETTGLSAKGGDRLIEIGCVEIFNRIPTGVEFHRFINPDGREVNPEAEAVHGISGAFLEGKPIFYDVVADFLEFIGDDTLVIHNASFDIGFLNMELGRLKLMPLKMTRVVDTLMIARRKHPAGPNSLDALCRRYGIDTSSRTKHGAIVDSLLLADVYVELLGERQAAFGLGQGVETSIERGGVKGRRREGQAAPRVESLARRLSADDEARHADFVKTLGDAPLWFGKDG